MTSRHHILPAAEVGIVLGLFFGIVCGDVVCVLLSDAVTHGIGFRRSLNKLAVEEEQRRLYGTRGPAELLQPFEVLVESDPVPEVWREHTERMELRRVAKSLAGSSTPPAIRTL